MISILFGALLFWAMPDSHVCAEEQDYCKVFGLIYETKDLREAQFRVFEEASDAFANVIIFEQENRLYADKPGHWAFTQSRNLADYVVYFVDERRKSDFSVYFTQYESFAGCNR